MLQKKSQSFPSQEPSVTNFQGGDLYLLATDVTTPLIHSKRKTLFSTSKQRNKKRIRSAGYRIGSLVSRARTHAVQCKNVYH